MKAPKEKTQSTRKKPSRRTEVVSSSDNSSSEDEEDTSLTKPKHILKPPKYDGTKPFETFCA